MPQPKQKRPKGAQSSHGTEDDRISTLDIPPLIEMQTLIYITADPRFANIQTDPRFRLPSRKDTHVRLDSRFSHMLHSDDFSSKAKVDRYGRKLPKGAGKKDLEKYYRIEDDDPDDEPDDDGDIVRELRRVEAQDEDSESSSDGDSDDSISEEEDEEAFGLDQSADEIPMGEVTSRIAVVNLDWDNIRSADLLAVFSSFLPSGGKILKVAIYPSEFGKERMEREEMEGPPKEIFGQNKSAAPHSEDESSSDESDEVSLDEKAQDEKIKQSLLKPDQGAEFNTASLRRYQISRLRYYYAVLICSSPSVAETIYNAVDGTEYLTTANFFDLRFIPDDTDFSADKARDECERIPDGYRPNEFVTDALQHSKVRLTWDADDGSRKEAQKRAFSGSRADIEENDLKAYLGSDSSDDEAPEPVIVDATAVSNPADGSEEAAPAVPQLSKKEAERQRMRSLLGLQAEPAPRKSSKKTDKAPVGDMQVTFTSGLSGSKGGVFKNEPEPDREETTVEKYIRKEKERKNRRKEKMKSSRNKDGDNEAGSEDGQDAENPDAGFDDPFFNEPATTSASLKKTKKRPVKEPSPDPEARAQIEQLITEDATINGNDVQHFDANLLTKGEKLSKKKHKHKLSERQKAALEAKQQDNFEINTKDPRFAAVFESNEYAIDPSHKGYRETGGMKKMLEEGRRKRGLEDTNDAEGGEVRSKKAKRRRDDVDDVQKLVQKVKKKEKAM